MHTRILTSVALTVASMGLLACASGEIDDGGGTFTTAADTANNTTSNPTTTSAGESETGHGEAEGETGDPPPPDPSCDDGEQNQDESDIDCGGTVCGPCGDGQACVEPTDCDTLSCVGGQCITPDCGDGVENGDETDVDCGGSCQPCADNLGCVEADDCESGVCAGSFCATPSCGDSVLNGNETDVDCGGARCEGCLEGEMCDANTDCVSQYCSGGLCAAADCLTDADCGSFDTQCTAGVCNANKTCDASPINDAMACDDGELCTTGEVCSAGACGGGGPKDCSGMSNACNLGVCNPMDGACQAQPANDNNPCNDNNACTVGEVCSAGACADPNAPGYVFYDDFNDNAAGWTLGTEWQIGAAAASGCASSCPGNDPATDHTATADNGIAGVVLGGCQATTTHADYCITSPAINTAGLATVWLSYWRHLHADYSPYMVSTVQVYNGNTWTQVFTTAGSCTNDAAWAQQGHNITAYKAANMQVRFCYSIGSAGVFASGQWNLDDVVVGPAQCTP